MTEALRTLISTIIITILTMTNSPLTPEQLTALYQCHFWNGSAITVNNSTAEVKNGHLYLDGIDSGYIYSIDPSSGIEYRIEQIATYGDNDGHWDADYDSSRIKLWLNSSSNYVFSIIVPTDGEWSTKVTEKYIYAYDSSKNKLVRLDRTTWETKYYTQ